MIQWDNSWYADFTKRSREIVARKQARLQRQRREHERDNRIALGVGLFTLIYLGCHLADAILSGRLRLP